MWLKDPKTGKPSVTLTAFASGFVVVIIKLLSSGIEFYGIKLSPFTGIDFAAAVGALGAIYVLRRHKSQKDK